MRKGKCSLIPLISALGAVLLFATLSKPTIVFANQPAPTPDHGSCINCHEDLYFLHDTGNWYCLRESPMSCVECHGGDPFATTQEQAHMDRAAHPVLNDDISKCQECHPQECAERMQKFDQTAGFSEVLVAMPYVPRTSMDLSSTIRVKGQKDHTAWINTRELLPVLFLVGVALVVYVVHKKRGAVREQP